MATSNYTALIEQLKTFHTGFSDSQFRELYSRACYMVRNSQLEESSKNGALKALCASCDSNDCYHYNSDGVFEALSHIEAAEKQLLTNANSCSIPLEGILSVSMGGQTFNFGGAA